MSTDRQKKARKYGDDRRQESGGVKNLPRFAFFIRLKWVVQHGSQGSPMSKKIMFKPLSCRRDGEIGVGVGGGVLVCFIFWLLSRFAGHSCFPPLISLDGAPCAKSGKATATTALRRARPQLSEPRVIEAD